MAHSLDWYSKLDVNNRGEVLYKERFNKWAFKHKMHPSDFVIPGWIKWDHENRVLRYLGPSDGAMGRMLGTRERFKSFDNQYVEPFFVNADAVA